MCNDAREDGVMFLSPEEFIGELPEGYSGTASAIRSKINDLQKEKEFTRSLRRVSRIKNELSILNSMLTDSCILATLTRRYYDTSYNNPKPLSMVQVPKPKGGQFGDVDYDERLLREIFEDYWRY